MWRILRWAGLTLVALILVIVAGVGGFVALGIPIELSGFKAPVERAASLAMGRKVRFDGAVSLAPSLEPTLQIEGVHVANAEGWSEPDLMYLGLARLQLAVLPLLERRIEVIEVAVDGFQVNLERSADGAVNWLLDRPAAPASETTEAPTPETTPSDTPVLSAFEVADLSLDNIVVGYRDAGTGADYTLTLDSIDGSAVRDQPMDLSIDGTVQEVPYTIAMSAGSLSALMRGDESWPVELSMTLLGATFDVQGTVAEPLRGAGLEATFSLSGDDLQDLEAFVGEDLPPVAGYSFTGRVVEEDTAYALTDFEGRLGRATFTGAFSVNPTGDLPELRGRLDIPTIDLGPVFAAIESGRPAGGAEQDDAQSEAELDLDQPFLTLDGLRALKGEFDMTVGEVVGAQASIRSAALSVAVADGVLRAPVQAEIADVGFSGELVLDGASDLPQASVALQASETDIGDLALALFEVEGIDGGFQGALIDAAVAGESIRDLVRSLDFTFALSDAALSYGNRPGETPVGFTLDAAEMRLPRGDVLQVSADGSVLEEPFSLAMVGGDITELAGDQQWPLEMTASGGGASLAVRGTMMEQTLGESSLAFELGGERIGGLSRWLGVSAEAAAPYAIEGTVRYNDQSLSVPSLSVRVGESVLAASYQLQERDTERLTTLSLTSDLLALDELAGLFPKPEDAPAPADEEEGVTIDVPILPGEIELNDADLSLDLAEVRTRRLDLKDVSFTGNIRDGQVKDSPFAVTVVGARLDGSVSLDLTGAVPRATFAVATQEVDVGQVLADLGVVEGLEVQAGRMSVDLALEGVTARQMMERSRFQAQIADGGWTLRDPNLEGELAIGLREGTISASPGQPIAMILQGDIEAEPVTIKLDTAPLAEFTDEKDSLPVNLEVALAGAVLSMDAVAGLPIETQGLRFRLDLRGDSLDSFDGLLEASLPPMGPYAIGGDFTVEPDRYRIDDFSLSVGESRMGGRFELATVGIRPRLDIDLTTDTLQLDDFRFGDWSPLAEEDAAEQDVAEEAADPEAEVMTEEEKEQVRALLSREVMLSLDAEIDLKVDEVLSGADELGSGTLALKLQDGRFEVAPLVVNIPGGSTEIELAYEPLEEAVQAEARARVERLDYGVLARRIDPESDVGGLISVDIELTSEAESLETIMGHANGYLDFAVWPKDLEASLFDLWAVNLVASVLPSVDSENESKFNCIIARFKVEDGIMTPEAILVDSSRIQASGQGNVDFKQETVNLTLAPKAKRPQMFSANTPIAVNGTFEDFGVGIAPGGLIGTVVRFTTSPVTTPFLWVFSTPVAEDGVEACAEAWAREPEDLLKEVKDSGTSQAGQQEQQ